MKQGH
jgi:NAD(P)-dependent dehydrogenase (short-subunit alcohol dehydrogenase family)